MSCSFGKKAEPTRRSIGVPGPLGLAPPTVSPWAQIFPSPIPNRSVLEAARDPAGPGPGRGWRPDCHRDGRHRGPDPGGGRWRGRLPGRLGVGHRLHAVTELRKPGPAARALPGLPIPPGRPSEVPGPGTRSLGESLRCPVPVTHPGIISDLASGSEPETVHPTETVRFKFRVMCGAGGPAVGGA
jgi:hypothetical protein